MFFSVHSVFQISHFRKTKLFIFYILNIFNFKFSSGYVLKRVWNKIEFIQLSHRDIVIILTNIVIEITF
jgi:hypothetical protein